MFGDTDRNQSEFSGDVNYLTRLNLLLYVCDESAMELNVNTWFHGLMALFRELSTEFKKGEEVAGEKFIEDINPLIGRLVKDNSLGKNEVSQELYKLLHKFEVFLRGIIKSAGLQNKMKEGAGSALK